MSESMLDDVLAIPDHVRDAVWRVDSAQASSRESAGLAIAGMGGSAIGADLAAAILADRLTGPMLTIRGYRLPAWMRDDWTVLASSYSGNTEETISTYRDAEERGIHRYVVSTGGELTERAREGGVSVVGLPGILQPRAAVAYMTVVSIQVAKLAGVAPGITPEIEAAAGFLDDNKDKLRRMAADLHATVDSHPMVVHGAELTVALGKRWANQMNENAKLISFYADLPEADHNLIESWSSAEGRISAVFLLDKDQHPRDKKRIELTAEIVAGTGARTAIVETEGETRTDRVLWSVLLGDLLSLEIAEKRGEDPMPVETIQEFKTRLGDP